MCDLDDGDFIYEDGVEHGQEQERQQIMAYLMRLAGDARDLSLHASTADHAFGYQRSEVLLRNVALAIGMGKHDAEYPTTAE